jgi:hypothetical protein
MATLKHQAKLKTDGFTRRYGGVPVLYLEAENDRYIYAEIWFRDRQQEIEFIAVDQVANASGCTTVINHVQNQRAQGNLAWGLVDRDALMAKGEWDLVWETNDATFNASSPFGQYVKATLLWELENYLADMDICEAYLARTGLRTARPVTQVHQEFREHCEALVPHAAYNAMAHQSGKHQAGDGMTNRFANRQAVEDYIQTQIISRHAPNEQTIYSQNLSRVDQFDHQDGTDQQRFEGLRRRIHGKALLSRLAKQHNLPGAVSHHLGHLAEEMSRANRVPDELKSFLDNVVGSSI